MARAVDDERDAVGPWLARAVGTPGRRRWIRRLLGGPALLARWVTTRWRTTETTIESRRPRTSAPTLGRFPGVQLPSAGVGPGVHRTYRVRASGAAAQAEAAIDRLATDPNLHCTIELGSFEVDDGRAGERLDLGRDLRVELLGPYEGPVRVVERSPRHVRLQTRSGHVEAGQIQFETTVDGDDLVFTIASWTRSRDRVVDALYRGGPARWLQQHMWISVCRQVALGAGASQAHVTVRTEWLPEDPSLLGEPPTD